MTENSRRPRLAVFSAAGCGGCEVVLLNLGDYLPVLADAFEIAFAPMLIDHKLAALAAEPDAGIDLCLYNGTVRTPDDEEMAHLLRRKARFLVAFGACAESGGVPALANTATVHELLARVAADSDRPTAELLTHALALPADRLPGLSRTARSLEEVELVDYTIPGCPPEPGQVRAALETLRSVAAGESGSPWPGTTLGASAATLCEECQLVRDDAKVKRFHRLHEAVAAPKSCLLEQGFVCLGVATRGGCGALCPQAGIPCNGCYGQPDGVADQGARMTAALATMIDIGTVRDDAAAVSRRAAAATVSVVDPIGTYYGFTLQRSLLARRRTRRGGGDDEERNEPTDLH